MKLDYQFKYLYLILCCFLMSFSQLSATVTVTADFDFEDNLIPAEFGAAAFGSGPSAVGGQLVFNGSTAIKAPASVIFDGTHPTDNYGYEVIATPSSFNAFDIIAAYVPGSGINSGGNFIFMQNTGSGRNYNTINPGVQVIGGTIEAVVGQTASVAVVVNDGTTQLYVNGQLDASGNAPANADTIVLGGNLFDGANGAFNGSIDHFRAFTFNADEFNPGDLLFEILNAHSPNPPDKAKGVSVEGVLLSWTAGDTAITHRLYMGTDEQAVAAADTDSAEFKIQTSDTSWGTGALSFGTTYYWRVDEVESTNPLVVHTGNVWSFTAKQAPLPSPLRGDFNDDCTVSMPDLQFMAAQWLGTNALANLFTAAEGGLDWIANDDYSILASRWGDTCLTLENLLDEMVDRDNLAQFPQVPYESLQHSSYNRTTKTIDEPGWLTNNDCCGFIRTESINGKTEWVIMEHDGPGCITRMWTPFFYKSLSNHSGPNIRIYLDGSDSPVIDENFIELLTGGDYSGSPKNNSFTVPAPFSTYTARAGNLFLPIPFAHSCKITTTQSPFYNIINYRGYAAGTPVKSFTMDDYNAALSKMAGVGAELTDSPDHSGGTELTLNHSIPAGGEAILSLPAGNAAVRHLQINLSPNDLSATLRSTVLQITFDGEQTVWCPVGDFFCSPDSIHPFKTFDRTVTADGTMVCRWVMPYETAAEIKLLNLGANPVTVDLLARVGSWDWDERSMHFRTDWRSDHGSNPGNSVYDWNFIEAYGKGVHVGDSLTVVYPGTIWWGEGDEKIWVDDDFEERFPSQHGTGTEDYYGWAGGEPPHGDTDQYSHPFTSNVKVGTLSTPRGYNICTRTRMLDATPFNDHFKMDMEAWSLEGGATDLVAYSSGVTHWYAIPGTTDNRKPSYARAAEPIYTVEILDALEKELKGNAFFIPNAIEFETHPVSSKSAGLLTSTESIPVTLSPSQWSNKTQLLVEAEHDGHYVGFEFGSQTSEKNIQLYLAKMDNYGIVRISLNGNVIGEYDTYAKLPNIMDPIDLGVHSPVDNAFEIRFEITGKNANSSGRNLGLDCIVFAN